MPSAAERLVRDRQLIFDLCLCALVTIVTTGYSLAVGEQALGLASLVITLPLTQLVAKLERHNKRGR